MRAPIIPQSWNDALTYFEQILYLKKEIDKLKESGGDCSDLYERIVALEGDSAEHQQAIDDIAAELIKLETEKQNVLTPGVGIEILPNGVINATGESTTVTVTAGRHVS